MPIRFKCPNPKCQKVLSVKDQLAGKKAACPACKQPLTIPAAAPQKAPGRAQRPTTDDASAVTTPEPPGDAEDLAMSMLADEVKPPAPVEQPKTISTTCPYCDEEVQFDVALAGKQAPCPNPECRRIIKVPQLVKQEKIDWRNTAPGLPSGARRPTEPAPEGAWGSTAKAIVSGEALEQAGALPSQRRAPLSKTQWAVRILMGGAAIGLVVVGVMVVLNWLGGKRQQKLLDKAMAAVSKDGSLKGPEAAIINLGAAQYHLRRNEPDCIKPDKGEAGAWNQFGLARSRLHTAESNPERDPLLIELALAQIDLGGSPEQVSEGKRLAWDKVTKELASTLGTIHDADARAEGLRRVTRKLIEKGQPGLAEELAAQLSDGPGPFAVVGLEFQRAGQADRAEKLLKQILAQLAAAKPKKDRPPPPPVKVTPETVTFLAAQQDDRTKELPVAKTPKEKEQEKDIMQVGKAVALAWQSKHSAAVTDALKARTAVLKLEALAAIADAPGDAEQIKATIDEAMRLTDTGFAGKRIPSWPILRLVSAGLRAGVAEDRLLVLAAKIDAKDGLKGWAQLPVARARLEREDGKAEESLADQVDRGSLANRLLRVELACHNARKDTSADKAVDGWDESLRPFGYMGVALGLQGGN